MPDYDSEDKTGEEPLVRVTFCNYCDKAWVRAEAMEVHCLVAHPESDEATASLLSLLPLHVRPWPK